ncbi:MAG TPA: beta-L-arabinofuranosidase domain-containing protein [Acidimicrobiales bacterium]|nr:beta-L-arabinofuranosidase domain-containing protein [Acidimicrobiales bacterium]
MTGPVDPVCTDRMALQPLRSGAFELGEGFWGELQRRNRSASIPYAMSMMEQSGTLENLRIAAGRSSAAYLPPVFRDSDLYKVLEAMCWERTHGRDEEQERFVLAAAELLAAAQCGDGYLNSYVQVVEGDRRFLDPAHGHELYCAGHLIQAAVADVRTGGGKSELLPVAERLADYLARAIGIERPDFVNGHPEIEMALVELYRHNRDAKLLDLAVELIGRRGRSRLTGRGFGPAYFQDDVAFASAREIRGHAVRALYLLCGASDCFIETGGQRLWPSIEAQWWDMVLTKAYVTGGLGSRHLGESFGDPFELPPDRAYCETCAAIASVMWSWRLLLLSGAARYAELIERTIYNAFLAGVGRDGTSFFYVNPLHARIPAARQPWYDVACCPPNVMRLLASFEHYLATETSRGVQLHQLVSGRLSLAARPGERFTCSVDTGYPFSGSTTVRVEDAPAQRFELSLRLPVTGGARRAFLNGGEIAALDALDYLRIERVWQVGDELALELELPVFVVRPPAVADAVRGCVAFERGPIVYCLEGVDLPPGTSLSEVSVDVTSPVEAQLRAIAGEQVVALELPLLVGSNRGVEAGNGPWWPYRSAPAGSGAAAADVAAGAVASGAVAAGDDPVRVSIPAMPYYAWANRGATTMRVWLPEAVSPAEPRPS